MIKPLALAALVSSILSLSVSAQAATSVTWENWKKAEEPEAYKILQYLDLGSRDVGAEQVAQKDGEARPEEMVVIAAGRSQGLVAGTVLRVFRPKVGSHQRDGGPLWVELGRLKAVDVQSEYTIAMIETQVTPLSKALFPRFPGIMAGDVVVPQRMDIARKQIMTPTVALSYQELFLDPKVTPATFELKAGAIESLKEAVRPFLNARLSLIMVEGYTDHNGPASANQIESYQRALTVRQYLIDELGFDERRVVAIGYGEAEPSDRALKPGYQTASRRIVFKAIPIPAEPTAAAD